MKPILFSTPMVQAILEGRKTQTRRVVTPQPPDDTWEIVPYDRIYAVPPFRDTKACFSKKGELTIDIRFPYKVGDILYVRETWAKSDGGEFPAGFYYRADLKSYLISRWRPSIHMPREAARLFLEVKNVRLERVQDITEEDAKREGVEAVDPMDLRKLPMSLLDSGGGLVLRRSYKVAFYTLWDTLNAKRGCSWESNPWVWVYEFERRELC